MKAFFKTLYRGWMAFAHVLGWINGRIILTVLYTVVLGPYAIVRRLAGVSKRTVTASYWQIKEKTEPTLENVRHIF